MNSICLKPIASLTAYLLQPGSEYGIKTLIRLNLSQTNTWKQKVSKCFDSFFWNYTQIFTEIVHVLVRKGPEPDLVLRILHSGSEFTTLCRVQQLQNVYPLVMLQTYTNVVRFMASIVHFWIAFNLVVSLYQCCGSGSWIQRFFDLGIWIRESRMGKNADR